jgi:hypothetical protein
MMILDRAKGRVLNLTACNQASLLDEIVELKIGSD